MMTTEFELAKRNLNMQEYLFIYLLYLTSIVSAMVILGRNNSSSNEKEFDSLFILHYRLKEKMKWNEYERWKLEW